MGKLLTVWWSSALPKPNTVSFCLFFFPHCASNHIVLENKSSEATCYFSDSGRIASSQNLFHCLKMMITSPSGVVIKTKCDSSHEDAVKYTLRGNCAHSRRSVVWGNALLRDLHEKILYFVRDCYFKMLRKSKPNTEKKGLDRKTRCNKHIFVRDLSCNQSL